MKKMRGFSLAEVLVCVAIIGVVTAFGGTIMKKSTAQAYRMYYRTGYENLYDALATIITENENEEDINSRDEMQDELKDIFDLNDDLTTKNGIKYEVTDANGRGCYIIEMTVPQQKTRNNRNGRSIAAFMFKGNGDGDAFLIPLNVNQPGYVQDLQTRNDLIPFYQDNGTAERSNGHLSQQVKTMNYKDAACQIYGDLYVTVPPAYASERSALGGVWGDNAQNSWDFNGGTRARIVNCTNIPRNLNSNEYSVSQYTGR